MNILVTVIIPHKNSHDTLDRLIESIPNTLDIQVLLVDDGSDVCPDLSRENLTVMTNDSTESGAGAARNVALNEAAGEWLLFADADDYFLPGAFDRIRASLTTSSDIVFFSPTSFNEHTRSLGNRHSAYEKLVKAYVKNNADWIRYRFHSPCSKLVRRSVVEENEIRFDPTYVANDMMFSLKVGLGAHAVDAYDESIYCITESHGTNLSSRRDEQFFDIRLGVHVRYNELLKERGFNSYQMAFTSVLKKALKLGLKKFLKTLVLAIRVRQPLLDRPSYLLYRYRK